MRKSEFSVTVDNSVSEVFNAGLNNDFAAWPPPPNNDVHARNAFAWPLLPDSGTGMRISKPS